MTAETEVLERPPEVIVATATAPMDRSEAAWDMWVEDVCAEVQRYSSMPQSPISFRAYVRMCMHED